MVSWTHVNQPPPQNGISIDSTVYAQLTRVLNNTDRHTDHATYDICSDRPPLCTACRRCGLKTVVLTTNGCH